MARFLSSESGIENNFLESGQVSPNQWQPLSQAIAKLSDLPIFINDNSCPTLTEIRSQVRRVSSQYGHFGLVVVDYLQLMAESTDPRMNMALRVGEISRGLNKIEEHFTDTNGFTDHVFGICHILGFRFCPRMRDLASKKLHVFDGVNKNSSLLPLLGEKINVKLIAACWDDILRLATSVSKRTVTASLLMRKLASYPR